MAMTEAHVRAIVQQAIDALPIAEAIALGHQVHDARPAIERSALEPAYGTVVSVSETAVLVTLDADQSTPVSMFTMVNVAPGQRVLTLLVPPSSAVVLGTLGGIVNTTAINNFPDETTRDGAIPAPVEGEAAYVVADHALQLWAGAVDGWQPPWNLPWGPVEPPVAVATGATDGAGTLNDWTGATITFNAIANRLYKITSDVNTILSTVGGDIAELVLVDGGGTIAGTLTRGLCGTAAEAALHALAWKSYAAGPVTVKAQVRRASGTGTVTFGAGWFSVLDDGPAGAPS